MSASYEINVNYGDGWVVEGEFDTLPDAKAELRRMEDEFAEAEQSTKIRLIEIESRIIEEIATP